MTNCSGVGIDRPKPVALRMHVKMQITLLAVVSLPVTVEIRSLDAFPNAPLVMGDFGLRVILNINGFLFLVVRVLDSLSQGFLDKV